MDEERLEELLKTAKKEADQFFSGWEVKSLNLRFGKNNAGQRRIFSANWKKLSLTFACLLLLLLFPLYLKKVNDPPSQTVVLHELEPAQLVDFVPIRNPDHTNQSLLVLLWSVSPEGQYKVAYSSLLNDSVFPNPVYTLDFPGSPRRMVLISSEDSEKKYLHYRLISYGQEDVKTVLTADYVPGGKLEIEDGKMVEERRGGLVTHILPFQIEENGELLTTSDQVELQRGEELLLIGLNFSDPVSILARKDILEEVSSKEDDDLLEARFAAKHPGEDYLQLIPNFNPAKGKSIYIKVVN